MGRLAGAILCLAFLCADAAAQNITFNVCMGNGGGSSCRTGSNVVSYTCSQYKAIGGGAPETQKALGERLCKVFDPSGQPRQLTYSVNQMSSKPGGECGWTLFTVTCLTAGR